MAYNFRRTFSGVQQQVRHNQKERLLETIKEKTFGIMHQKTITIGFLKELQQNIHQGFIRKWKRIWIEWRHFLLILFGLRSLGHVLFPKVQGS